MYFFQTISGCFLKPENAVFFCDICTSMNVIGLVLLYKLPTKKEIFGFAIFKSITNLFLNQQMFEIDIKVNVLYNVFIYVSQGSAGSIPIK